jgi:hypothetical protein
MINETNLRFAFHMDAGNFPMRNGDEKVLDNGYPTSEYGRWLEEHAGNAIWLQRTYQFENKTAPIHNSPRRCFKRWSLTYQKVYDAPYCFWLEERILKKRPEIIKNILHI